MNVRNRSTKSGFIGLPSGKLPLLHGEGPHEPHTVGRGDLLPVVEIVPIGLGVRRIPPHRDTVPGTSHHTPSIPTPRCEADRIREEAGTPHAASRRRRGPAAGAALSAQPGP